MERLLAPELFLVAPDLLIVETMNALLRKQRRREVSASLPPEALGTLSALRIDARSAGADAAGRRRRSR